MRSKFSIRRSYQIIIVFLLSFIIASCNLTGAPEEQIEITDLPTTSTALPTRTPMIGDGIPTASGVTPLPTQVGQLPPTSPVIIPTQQIAPANTPLPVSIFILSPIPGNVIAGNVQVIGSASHPEFLQYQLEYGPDPNPSNLWFPVTGAIQSTVQNGLLGIWNTTTVQDSTYQLRLRVFLRDGTDLRTVVNNVRVQNQAPTPIPTATPVAERPIAAFTQDRATGVAPLVVRFTNQSTGEINNYQWAFGDGSSSSALNPTHTFNTPGTYNVVLSVSGPGGTSNVSRQITVQSATPPIAAFTPSTTGGPAPLNVAFTNESQGNITSQTWNFGDGTTSEDVSPSHTFTDVGTYNVILTVQGPGGSSSVTRRITVEDASVPPPDAAFLPNEPVSGEVPLTVQFDNQTTGEVESYEWDFGDGATSPSTNPEHTFTQSGQYTVRLTAFGPGGQSTAEVQVEVIQPPDAPVASFDIQGETTGPAPLTVGFVNTSTGQIDQNRWTFNGDEITTDDDLVEYTFNEPGTYTVALQVSNQSGSDTATATVNVLTEIEPPVAQFQANPTSGPAPLSVQFQNQSTGDNLSYRWEIVETGQEISDTAGSFTYEFTESGNYTIRLTAANMDEGLIDTAEVGISVSDEVVQPPPDPLDVAFSATPRDGDPATFDLSASAQGGTGSYSFTWEANGQALPDGQQSSVTFPGPGEYTIILRVNDGEDQVERSQSVSVAAPAEPLDAAFSATPRDGDPSTFDLSASAQGGTGNYSFTWQTSEGHDLPGEPQISVTFTTIGEQTIILRVNDGETEVERSQNVTVSPPAEPLDAAFSATPRDGDPATFDLSASAQGGTGSYSFTWEANGQPLPDGQQSSVTFPGSGEYTIILRVNDGEDQVERSQSVSVAAPAEPLDAAFSATPRDGDPATFDLSASAQGGTGNYSFTWQTSEGHDLPAEPQISVTFAGIGEQTIVLRVNDGEDQVERSQGVNIPEPEPDVSTEFIMNTPIMPDWGALRDPLRQIHQSTETNTSVFGIAGDQTAAIDTYLQPFAGIDPDSPLVGPLRDIVVRYQSAISDGVNSFNYDGVATGDGLIALDFLTAAPAPGCEDGEILFVCEIRQLGNPSVILVHVGTNDIAVGTPRSEFESQLNQIIDRAVERGVIPILATTYPMAGEVTQEAVDVNEAIITVASGRNVPLFNQWRALAELSNNGLDGGGNPSVHPEGPAFVAESSDFGANMRNRYILLMLDALFRDVLN